MVKLLVDDYRQRFRPYYDRAAPQRNFGLEEPESEIFNAFNHLAWVCEYLTKLDDPATPKSDLKKLQSAAELELALARQHIWLGRIYCIEHLIESISGKIAGQATMLSHLGRDSPAGWAESARQLDARYNEQSRIIIEETRDINLVKRNTARMISETLVEMTDILRGYAALYKLMNEEDDPPEPG